MLVPTVLLAYSIANTELSFDRVEIDADFPGCYQVEAADVNGDGKLDIVALGGGTVAWYQNPSWQKRIISLPNQTPGVISSATADIDGDGKAEIVIAYDFEMNEPKRGKLMFARQGKSLDDPWTLEPIGATEHPPSPLLRLRSQTSTDRPCRRAILAQTPCRRNSIKTVPRSRSSRSIPSAPQRAGIVSSSPNDL